MTLWNQQFMVCAKLSNQTMPEEVDMSILMAGMDDNNEKPTEAPAVEEAPTETE